jgi:hypothetical protein
MVRAMSTPHKASAEQWSDAGAFASDTRACLLELRARVEALEREAAMNELRAASAEARPAPASSLVERVDRAAIREVAAWLRDRGGYPWAWVAQTLEQEADR